MNKPTPPAVSDRTDRLGRRELAVAAAVAAGWVLLVQVVQARFDLNLADEGFLWYGVQRTLRGEWPIRDFQAYDPGRYWAFAAWAKLVGSDGIVALRLGLAAVEWSALWAAAVLFRRVSPSRWVQVVGCGLLALWMGPRHKLPDAAAGVWVTAALAAVAARPDARRLLLAGGLVGGLWAVGVNHAAYAAAATAAVVGFGLIVDRPPAKRWFARAGWTAAGVGLGAVPMAVVLLWVRGFATAYWHQAIEPLARRGATNLTAPVPWPWRLPVVRPVTWAELAAVSTGAAFVAVPTVVLVAGGLTVVRSWRRRFDRPVLLAATAAAAVWSHHAFARADLSHLSQAVAPALIAAIALPTALSGRTRQVAVAVVWPALVVATLAIVPALSPVFNTRFSAGAEAGWQRVGGERLYVARGTADVCRAAAAVAGRNGPGQTDLFVPYAPGLYAVLRLPCPIYESYPLFPATADEQAAAIDRLTRSHTAAVVCWSTRVDGRPDLGFDQTDPVLWQYVLAHYHLTGWAAGAAVFERPHR